ncbi:MAG TPA: ROK family protein [Thermoanaerobaculia bacterium]
MKTEDLTPVIAIDLGGTKIAVASVSERGTVRQRMEEPVDRSSALEQIVRMAREIDGEAVGVAVPGLVRRDGTVWAPNLPGWDRVPLARELKRKLRLPVFVESDRNAVVLGESWRGAARGKSDVIVLMVGTGIGAGILSGGNIVRGAHELSGCAGWMVVSDEANEMTSRVGALESLASGPAIARVARAESALAVAIRARKGQRDAVDALKAAARQLGRAIANLVSLFDPEIIVMTGGLMNAGDLFLDDVKHSAREFAQPLSFPHVEIVISTLGTEANLLGAARLALTEDRR